MKRVFLSLVACAILLPAAFGEEGMWMPKQLPDIGSKLKADGLALDPKTMTQLTEFPMNAVVSLGGCTASFVSPQGLVVTNHHCAFGSLQYNSTVQKNILRDGFLAKTLAEEVPAAPGSRVFVTVDVQNVTDKIIDPKTAKLTGKERIEGSRPIRSRWLRLARRTPDAAPFQASTVDLSSISLSSLKFAMCALCMLRR